TRGDLGGKGAGGHFQTEAFTSSESIQGHQGGGPFAGGAPKAATDTQEVFASKNREVMRAGGSTGQVCLKEESWVSEGDGHTFPPVPADLGCVPLRLWSVEPRIRLSRPSRALSERRKGSMLNQQSMCTIPQESGATSPVCSRRRSGCV